MHEGVYKTRKRQATHVAPRVIEKGTFSCWFSEVDGLMRAREMSTKPPSMLERLVP
jgi:hypothetical protein